MDITFCQLNMRNPLSPIPEMRMKDRHKTIERIRLVTSRHSEAHLIHGMPGYSLQRITEYMRGKRSICVIPVVPWLSQAPYSVRGS